MVGFRAGGAFGLSIEDYSEVLGFRAVFPGRGIVGFGVCLRFGI